MVAYPGRREEVHSGRAITATQDILHFQAALPTDPSSNYPHTMRGSLSEGRETLTKRCDNCMNTFLLVLGLMGTYRSAGVEVISSWKVSVDVAFFNAIQFYFLR